MRQDTAVNVESLDFLQSNLIHNWSDFDGAMEKLSLFSVRFLYFQGTKTISDQMDGHESIARSGADSGD